MQIKSIFNSKKILSTTLIFLSGLFINNLYANELIYELKFNNKKPINHNKIQKKSSVFLAPEHWQAGINERHVWVEPQKNSENRFVFYARNGNNVNNPYWAHKRAAGVRFFSWD